MPARCPRCDAATSESRFCPNCGLPLEPRSGDTAVEQLPPDETGQVPVSILRAEPGLLRAVTSAARAVRESSLGRETARALDMALAGADVVVAGLKARSRAERELLGLRRELRDAFREREEALRQLGDAVYRDDAGATETQKARIGALDESIEEMRKTMQAILEQAATQVRATQLEVQPTQIQPPDVPEPYPPPGEVDPPQHPEIPEPYPPPGELDPPQQPDIPEPSPPAPDTAP